MLNINKSIEYSLIAIKHIKSKSNKSCSTKEIAKQYNIPKELLAKILQRFVSISDVFRAEAQDQVPRS